MTEHDLADLRKIGQRYYSWGETSRLYSTRPNILIEFWVGTYYPVRVQPISIMDNFTICLFYAFGQSPSSQYRILTFNLREKNIWTQLVNI